MVHPDGKQAGRQIGSTSKAGHTSKQLKEIIKKYAASVAEHAKKVQDDVDTYPVGTSSAIFVYASECKRCITVCCDHAEKCQKDEIIVSCAYGEKCLSFLPGGRKNTIVMP